MKDILKELEISTASQEDIEYIDKKLGDFNAKQLNFIGESEIPIGYIIRQKDQIIAGISACVDWGHVLYIDLLYVEEDHRKSGIGSFLLNQVETKAKDLGAGLAQVDTFDFQGKDFYLKHGYEIFGTVENCPRPGHRRFYMKKVL